MAKDAGIPSADHVLQHPVPHLQNKRFRRHKKEARYISLLSIHSSTPITLGNVADEIIRHCSIVAARTERDSGRQTEQIYKFGFLLDKYGPAFIRPEPSVTGWQLIEAMTLYEDIKAVELGPNFPQYLHTLNSDNDEDESDDSQDSEDEDEDGESIDGNDDDEVS